MPDNPLRAFDNVSWSFAEPVPGSLNDFIAAAEDYASSIDRQSPGDFLREATPYREIDINYEYWIQRDDGEWEAIPMTVHLEKAVGPLTKGELLWRVHTVCHPHLSSQDHCYFEGFRPVGELGGVPTFEIVLGS